MFFKRKKQEEELTKVVEISLQRHYSFMYTNSVLSSQHELYLLLERTNDEIACIKFDGLRAYKYGYPNDEVGHPLMKFGLSFYGFFEVIKSPWILEMMENNRSHHRHSDSLFSADKHFIAKFKDVTMEVISDSYKEIILHESDIISFVQKEIKFLDLNAQQ